MTWTDLVLVRGEASRNGAWLRVSFGGVLLSALAISTVPGSPGHAQSPAGDYDQLVLADNPVAYWRFEEDAGPIVTNRTTADAPTSVARLEGKLVATDLGEPGPRPHRFPVFEPTNRAAYVDGFGDYIIVEDPGAASAVDFTRGDEITVEAWVLPYSSKDDSFATIIGKGLTKKDPEARNINWALGLKKTGATTHLAFRFHGVPTDENAEPQEHLWTSSKGLSQDGNWHHLAVTYTFGSSETLRGYVDGRLLDGDWTLPGDGNATPIVDNDDVWLGGARGGEPEVSFDGRLDEVALYRHTLSGERLANRFVANPPPPPPDLLGLSDLPEDAVVVQLIEGIPAHRSWNFDTPIFVAETYEVPAFAFVGVPRRYSSRGHVVDRPNPFLLRATGRVELAAGRYHLLLRSFNAARLFVDGERVASTRFFTQNGDGHEEVPDHPEAAHPELRPLPPGHAEELVQIDVEAGEHVIRLEAMVGAKNLRQEVGELCVAWAPALAKQLEVAAEEAASALEVRPAEETLPAGGARSLASAFRLLVPPQKKAAPRLSDGEWDLLATEALDRLDRMNRERRREASRDEARYWVRRHEILRQHLEKQPPIPVPTVSKRYSVHNAIDSFIAKRLEEQNVSPTPWTDDWSFLRRVSLDIRGLLPTTEEVRTFTAGATGKSSAARRSEFIDDLLESPSWADHWVSYWQDVLAENPGLVKPKLNNTGPFRWWIHDALSDNLPMDRFVTDLCLMEGSRYGGAPAGFAMATENDVPMAAKAHILGTAFLGLQMKCARCHDAPHHSYQQEDLFRLAAMLGRGAQEVPTTSSVPGSHEELSRLIVEVTLEPGSRVEPSWPFASIVPPQLPAEWTRKPGDTREHLAAMITSPESTRFAEVVANRIWKRYLGYGLIEPVDDWEGAQASHPDLLAFLGREFMASGYDLKVLARLILNSNTYQRQAIGDPHRIPRPAKRLFAGPARRRMSAEQIVDSLFQIARKPFGAEQLTIDVDGRRPVKDFLNLGYPRRAWEFVSLSNERDRPALSLPVAQSIVDVLKAFGWRETRQDPITVREDVATVLQPLTLANGVVAQRFATLSDDSALTTLCLEDRDLDDLIEEIYLRVLTRPPFADETARFQALLAEDYETRILREATLTRSSTTSTRRHNVSWSNHLSAEATRIKLDLERKVQEGDAPSERLLPDWRERLEDGLWALMNSPEFVFVP